MTAPGQSSPGGAGTIGRAVAVGAVLALALAACSGQSAPVPLAAMPSTSPSLPADRVAPAVADALATASAVRVAGSVHHGGQDVHLDMRLARDRATGTVDDGTPLAVRYVGGVAYFQLTRAFLDLPTDPIPAADRAAAAGRWVSEADPSVGEPLARSNSTWYELASFRAAVGPGLVVGAVTAAGTTTVDGTAAWEFHDSVGDTVDVATAAPHRPVRVLGPATQPWTLTFTGWNAPVTVVAPPATARYTPPS